MLSAPAVEGHMAGHLSEAHDALGLSDNVV